MNQRHRLFLCHNGPRGDVLFSRAVFAALAADPRLELVLGCNRDDAVLLQDLAGPHCRIVTSSFANTPHGAIADLRHLCPAGFQPLEVWLGGNEAQPSYQWEDVVDSLQHDLRRFGIDFAPAAPVDQVPMLDFAVEVALPPLPRPAIYLDNARTAHEYSHFVFDFARLAAMLPEHDLLCTAKVAAAPANVVDIARLSPVHKQKRSEHCVARIGCTWDPFALTLTEANRFRPKALCGWDARQHRPVWDYPGNPIELLAGMDDLCDWLRANVLEACPA